MGISAQSSISGPSRVAGWLLLFLALLTQGIPATAGDRDVLVFAAASLADAMTEIAGAYTEETGSEVSLVFAASSALARQIENGAPAAVFVSANPDWIDRLDRDGMLAVGTRIDLVGNRLALIAPVLSSVEAKLGPSLELASLELPALLGDSRLAIGDPDHVPAGIYARAALESLGLWAEVESHLARTGDVRGALALVARGEAPLGIVYATDAAITDRVRLVGLFPADSHPAIVYPAAVIADAPAEAGDFLEFLAGSRARAIFAARGFSAPAGGDLDPAS